MGSPIRATLYLRDSVPMPAMIEQQRVLGRLRTLTTAGVLDEFEVEEWPTRVTMETTETAPALALYDGFVNWAHDHGATINPAFGRHDCHSRYTHTRYTTTVFPVMCLAVYEDETLRAVYPHAHDRRSVSVMDGLAMLESDSWREELESPTVTGRA
ncbi:MAG: HTH domain-containing protein [Halorientalis sp.]